MDRKPKGRFVEALIVIWHGKAATLTVTTIRGAKAAVGLLVAVVALATSATALAPAGASAAPSRYVYEMCDSVLAGGGVDGVVYGAHPRGLFSAEDTCAQPGGALILRQNEIAAGDGGATSWAVPISTPAGETFESITVSANACGATEPSIWSIDWTTPATNWPTPNCGEDVRAFRSAGNFKAFFIELRCVNGPGASNCHAGPWVLAHYFATTFVDPTAPRLSGLDGSLLDPGVKRGHQNIGVEADDSGGGVSRIFVTVNGVTAAPPTQTSCNVAQAHNPSIIGTVAAQPTPCPLHTEGHWTLDTATYPFRDGLNTVAVCASDFATLGDPNTTCSAPRSVEVDDSCSESKVAGGEVLSAQFESSNAEQATVGFGRSATVSGRLANNAGDPIRGASLCVKMATIGVDQQAAAVGSVSTDAEGRYRYEVPPGPNREVVVGYRHDAVQVAREVLYYAHAKPSLRVSSARVANGDRVRFRGALPGPSNAGRVVVLQAGTVGSKRWITFRKATSKAKGVFGAGYHFTRTTRRTRYKFRAVVPRQAGYPWVAGQSKPVKVLVTR
jgi:hypothetical protein